MIRRIVLKNFMSHSETTIVPAEGLTVLAGPNNCGKSAVITALQTLCYNERGNFMVRHGASSCHVVVETSEGHILEWERSKKHGVRYIIDGREVDRLRGSVPDDLHDKLRLPHVESVDGSDGFDIHFGEQKKPIFLLDQNGRQAATFFASSSDAALLVEMQAEHKRNVNDLRSDERNLTRDIARCVMQLEPLAQVPEIESSVGVIESTYEQLVDSFSDQAKLAEAVGTLDAQIGQRMQFLDTMGSLAFLKTPPPLIETENLSRVVSQFDDIHQNAQQIADRQEALGRLAAPPDLANTQDLEELVAELVEQSFAVELFAARQLATRNLENPPAIVEDEELQELIEEIESELQTQAVLEARLAGLTALDEPPELMRTEELTQTVSVLVNSNDTVSELQKLNQRFEQLIEPPRSFDLNNIADLIEQLSDTLENKTAITNELKQLETERHEAIQRLYAWAENHPICPTCGADIKPDAWIDPNGRELHSH